MGRLILTTNFETYGSSIIIICFPVMIGCFPVYLFSCHHVSQSPWIIDKCCHKSLSTLEEIAAKTCNPLFLSEQVRFLFQRQPLIGIAVQFDMFSRSIKRRQTQYLISFWVLINDQDTGDWDYVWLKTCIPYHFCSWKPQDGIFSNFTLSPSIPKEKCKVGENAVLGLSKPELVRNACFYIELVSVTCDQDFKKVQEKAHLRSYDQKSKHSVDFVITIWSPERTIQNKLCIKTQKLILNLVAL